MREFSTLDWSIIMIIITYLVLAFMLCGFFPGLRDEYAIAIVAARTRRAVRAGL